MLDTLTVAKYVEVTVEMLGWRRVVEVYSAYGRAYSVLTVDWVILTVEVRTYDLSSETFLHTVLLWYNIIMHYAKVPSGICTKGYFYQPNSGI